VAAARAGNALLPSVPSAAVPPRPEDVTVPVIVLFTIVSSCVTDCNFNIIRCPHNGPVREVSVTLNFTLTLYYICVTGFDRLGATVAAAAGHLDPLWLAELQRRYVTSGGPPPPPSTHIPGVFPPHAANLPPDVLQRERERIGKCHLQL